jgi:hypothetical protein
MRVVMALGVWLRKRGARQAAQPVMHGRGRQLDSASEILQAETPLLL